MRVGGFESENVCFVGGTTDKSQWIHKLFQMYGNMVGSATQFSSFFSLLRVKKCHWWGRIDPRISKHCHGDPRGFISTWN